MESSYVLDLERWGVKNNGTDAVNTSKGLNSALAWASREGYVEFVLPKGTYLIDENNPIQPQSFMTFNLGGSVLRINDNSLIAYAILSIKNKQQYVRVTNGKIEGDRYNHNYTSGGTHEFGVGIELKQGVSYISLDNLEIFNTTGDAIIAITSYGGIGGGYPSISGNLENGGINTTDGTLVANTKRIRTKVKLPIVTQILNTGYFGLYGDSYGGIGKEITTDTYDIIFYKSNDTFLTSVTNVHFFDEVEVPFGASYARAVLHQSSIPSKNGNTIVVRTPEFPKHVYIEKCNLHHCRRLGIAICGVKHFYVRGCEIHHISGTSPAGAIDIEDGYDLNQYIYLEKNNIYDNPSYNIIVVAGRHINITNNKLKQGIFTVNSGVNKTILNNNYFHDVGPRLSGDTIFSDNHLFNCRMLLLGEKEVLLENCFFHNSPINFGKTKAYVAQVNNCKFSYDEDFYGATENPGSPLIFSVEPQSISDCIFEGSGVETFTVVPSGTYGWHLTNVIFKDIKHRDNRLIRLPAGTYIGCRFINTGRLGEGLSASKSVYEFHNCYFEWEGYSLFYMGTSDIINHFKINNCYFNGKTNAFYLRGAWGNLDFQNNVFNYSSSSSIGPMIELVNTITVESLTITNNRFISNNSLIAVYSEGSPNVPLLFKDNILQNVQIRLNNKHVKLNNYIDGVLDPY
ncbi:right-handed parallel beta-helix repeat-containing protein [Peribacillus sp. NPDC097675]|uniref:right-handed parallel beta-helix repeat-containing protein n=1 Tax=Peribacillus sp. NPDC097675 TaxID=3390618 RepID=UPI003CFFC836